METTNGALKFPGLQADPPTLLGRPAHELSTMDGTIDAGQDNAIGIYGDWSNYVITQRVGSSVELIPHLFGANRRPTGHLPVAAMCAIDALGIPLMTGTDGVVDSTDPTTGASIRIHRRGDEWTWDLHHPAVVIAHTNCCGTLADTLCGSITFHTDQQHAQSHLDNHPELQGHIIGQPGRRDLPGRLRLPRLACQLTD